MKNTYYRSVRVLLPQIFASFVASAAFIPLYGINFGYSAVYIGQMDDCADGITNCTDTLYLTEEESSWIASALTISIPVGAMISSTIMDSVGRLNLVLLSSVPGVIGWTIIALSNSTFLVILGRICNGIAAGWSTCGAFVYISETTRPDIRGSMAGVASMLGALGIALTYVMGYFISWRAIAWVAVGITIFTGAITRILPKSPVWLVSKGRVKEAEESLRWMNQFHEDCEGESKNQLEILKNLDGEQKDDPNMTTKDAVLAKLKMFLLPTVYKPILILPVLNFLVQFSGVLTVVYHAVSLFKDAGTDMDPFLASIYFGTARFFASLLAIVLMRRFGRRPLLMSSGLIMAVGMIVSGLYTMWIQEGTTTATWVPVVFIILYVTATMTGFVGISQSISAEVFPTAVRGMAQSISMSILFGMSFASVYCYYTLNNAFGGSAGLQFFYAATAFAGVVYTFVFIPETHNKSLHEIEEYFKRHTTYLSYSLTERKNKTKKEMAEA